MREGALIARGKEMWVRTNAGERVDLVWGMRLEVFYGRYWLAGTLSHGDEGRPVLFDADTTALIGLVSGMWVRLIEDTKEK